MSRQLTGEVTGLVEGDVGVVGVVGGGQFTAVYRLGIRVTFTVVGIIRRETGAVEL